jgi:flagellar protein FlaG
MSSEMSIRPVSSPSVNVSATSSAPPVDSGTKHVTSSQPIAASLDISSMKELVKAQQQGESVQISDVQVIKMIERANKALTGRNTTFEFSIHKQTKQILVKVLDKDTGETIREIPPEKTLDMVAKMWELAGLLVDERW